MAILHTPSGNFPTSAFQHLIQSHKTHRSHYHLDLESNFSPNKKRLTPGTLNKQFDMDGNAERLIFH